MVGFGSWGPHVSAWADRSAPTVLVRFDDLIREPTRVIFEALRAADYPVDDSAGKDPPTFEELHAKWPAFFRKGKVGGWQQEMPPKLVELFWRLHGSVMTEMGYPPAS